MRKIVFARLEVDRRLLPLLLRWGRVTLRLLRRMESQIQYLFEGSRFL